MYYSLRSLVGALPRRPFFSNFYYLSFISIQGTYLSFLSIMSALSGIVFSFCRSSGG